MSETQETTVTTGSEAVAVSVGTGRTERVFAASYAATGRRKNAVARVILRPGTGKIVINNRDVEEYLPTALLVQAVHEPFEVTQLQGRFDAIVTARGGGFAGQAGAVRHAISRALSLIDETTRSQLKAAGLLTRDARMKERKKAGQPGARKKFQFSKR